MDNNFLNTFWKVHFDKHQERQDCEEQSGEQKEAQKEKGRKIKELQEVSFLIEKRQK